MAIDRYYRTPRYTCAEPGGNRGTKATSLRMAYLRMMWDRLVLICYLFYKPDVSGWHLRILEATWEHGKISRRTNILSYGFPWLGVLVADSPHARALCMHCPSHLLKPWVRSLRGKPSLTTISVSLHLNYNLLKTARALQLGLVVSKDPSAPSIPAQISKRADFKRADHLVLFPSFSQRFSSLAQEKFLLRCCQQMANRLL